MVFIKSVFFPEATREEYQYGHNLQTAHEHEQTENPLDEVGKD